MEKLRKEQHYIDGVLVDCLSAVRPIRDGVNTGRLNLSKTLVGKTFRIYLVEVQEEKIEEPKQQ